MLDGLISQFLDSRDKSNFGVKDKIFFFREMGYLLEGWVAIYDAVMIVNNGTDNYALKEITRSIAEGLNGGKTFSYCLSRLPRYFNAGDVNIVKSGEKWGNMNEILKSLAREYDYIAAVQSKYLGALLYPAILLIVSVGAIFLLFTYVLPGIFQILVQFDSVQIPLMTQILMQTTQFVNTHALSLLGGLGGLILFAAIFFSTEVWGKFYYSVLFEIPVIGSMTKAYYLIKFSRYMKIMLGAGMNYLDTFLLLKNILWISAYQDLLNNVIEWLNRGQTIYDSMKYNIDLIPVNVLVLLKVGEETARLENALDNIITIYEAELNDMLNNLSKVIEPVLIVFVWWIIVVAALSVFGIIWSILESIQVG